MTSFKTIALAALLSAVTAAPLFAQAAVNEPGAYSFYHPNADVLNAGAPTPAAGLATRPSAPPYQAYAAVPDRVRHPHRHRVHR